MKNLFRVATFVTVLVSPLSIVQATSTGDMPGDEDPLPVFPPYSLNRWR